jgi:SpoVK/Ycf46/Vps4 family AAA+-type ATPase
MNGKLIVRLVEAALAGKLEQVKIITNLLSSEMLSYDPESSKSLKKMVSGSLRSAPERVNPHPIKSVNENGFFLLNQATDTSTNELILSEENESKISQIIKEHENSKKLQSHGLSPIKTILFNGPPGVGKTLTAKWLAKKMNIPLRIVDLASVMSSLLGKTGNNIKSVFEDAASTPCVLLLDEFDAIAKKRADEHDVGELKRLLTVLLQLIDSWPSSSILIAATNHPELLDPAVWRRFELKLDFSNPDSEQVKRYLFEITKEKRIANLYFLFPGMSYSEIKNEIMKCKKISILDGKDFAYQLIVNSTGSELSFSLDEKKIIAKNLVNAKISQRKVSELLNISRPTIKKALAE